MLFLHQGEVVISLHVSARATPNSDGFLFCSPFAEEDIRRWERTGTLALSTMGAAEDPACTSLSPGQIDVHGPAPPGDVRAEAGPP